MGMEAVDKINRINRGEEEKKNTYVKTKTIIRESCGCRRIDGENKKEN